MFIVRRRVEITSFVVEVASFIAQSEAFEQDLKRHFAPSGLDGKMFETFNSNSRLFVTINGDK